MEIKTLHDRLRQHNPRTISENTNFAAVAIVLLEQEKLHELFIIKRASHPDDPWSGQIGLPGGRHEQHDVDLIETAIRETQEETNILLTRNNLISQIDDQQGYAAGGKINLTVRPFVFLLNQNPVVSINYELDHYYWLPTAHFQDKNNHVCFNPMPAYRNRPGVQLNDSNVVWGMTYRILADFFAALKVDTPFVGDYDQSR